MQLTSHIVFWPLTTWNLDPTVLKCLGWFCTAQQIFLSKYSVLITIVGKSPRFSGQHQPRPQSQSFTLWHFWDPIGGCRFEWSEKLWTKRWFDPTTRNWQSWDGPPHRALRMRSVHLFHVVIEFSGRSTRPCRSEATSSSDPAAWALWGNLQWRGTIPMVQISFASWQKRSTQCLRSASLCRGLPARISPLRLEERFVMWGLPCVRFERRNSLLWRVRC